MKELKVTSAQDWLPFSVSKSHNSRTWCQLYLEGNHRIPTTRTKTNGQPSGNHHISTRRTKPNGDTYLRAPVAASQQTNVAHFLLSQSLFFWNTGSRGAAAVAQRGAEGMCAALRHCHLACRCAEARLGRRRWGRGTDIVVRLNCITTHNASAGRMGVAR